MEPDAQLPDDALAKLESSAVAPDVRRIAAELLPGFYQQLRRIAHRTRARLGGGHTLQTTALVHEAYLRLGQSRGFVDETHFLRAAALAMRHALINYAQSRVTAKRGGGGLHVTLSGVADLAVETDEGMLALNEALGRLAGPGSAACGCCRVPVLCRLWRGGHRQDAGHVVAHRAARLVESPRVAVPRTGWDRTPRVNVGRPGQVAAEDWGVAQWVGISVTPWNNPRGGAPMIVPACLSR